MLATMSRLWLLAPLALSQAACTSWYRAGPEVRTVDQRLVVAGRGTVEAGIEHLVIPLSLSGGATTDDGTTVMSLESGMELLGPEGDESPLSYVIGPRIGGMLAGPSGSFIGLNGGPLLELDSEFDSATVLSLELFAGTGMSGDARESFVGGATLSIGTLNRGVFRVPHGRVLRAGGAAVVAEACPTADWLDPCRVNVALPDARRRALGEQWLEQGLEEHASIAAFVRLYAELGVLGAPAALLGAVVRAAADEVRHARQCFSIAAAYLGTPVGPGALPALGALSPNLARIAFESLVDGWFGEGAAARLAATRARTEGDPVVRRVLSGIARDEARHAELGWHTLAWCRRVGGARVRWAAAEAQEACAALTAGAARGGRAFPEFYPPPKSSRMPWPVGLVHPTPM